jgi:hypothetical protein
MATKKTSKSTVNKAGNYTKPTMRKSLFNKIKASETRAASRASGAREKRKCLPRSTRPRVEATKTNGSKVASEKS